MQQNNLEVYASQKHFIENAAHELQTPLAVAINKLEHLAESKELRAEQLKLLSAALDNLDRLTRLNRSLLLLSKIENRQYTDESDVNIREVAQQIREDFDDQVEYKQLRFEMNVSDCVVRMNYDLAAILITNLLKNAIVHTAAGGHIQLDITNSELCIANPGMAPLDHGTLFSRFAKQSHSSHSTGLGLSVVKAITDLYGFSAAYSYQEKHIITIRFR
jgi:signal transduction histidine kinase